MKLYIYNNGLFHHCPEIGDTITNRYYLINDYFKCDMCSLKFPIIIATGSHINHITYNTYRIGEIESFNSDYFIYENINPNYIEL